MTGFDYDRLQRIVVIVGIAVVAALWIAEDAGLILVASPALPAPAEAAPLPYAPGGRPALVLQGIIAGNDAAPAVALLAESGKRPVLVPEGSSFNDDIRVERVLADRVLLRRRGDSAPVVLTLAPLAAVDGLVPAAPVDGLSPPPSGPDARVPAEAAGRPPLPAPAER